MHTLINMIPKTFNIFFMFIIHSFRFAQGTTRDEKRVTPLAFGVYSTQKQPAHTTNHGEVSKCMSFMHDLACLYVSFRSSSTTK
ncbi:hypothetical protein APU01nite_02330 [Alkalibacterium putridalgicola]|uniref:Secreted protein n=1 Tax=Alkalibacterium putridalgicola TaxID=426703 RepID=A0ABQ0UUJ3_9LACT|nr:hypothetical protein APU01nite_02330 [Alkalibacterium putridalgicola]